MKTGREHRDILTLDYTRSESTHLETDMCSTLVEVSLLAVCDSHNVRNTQKASETVLLTSSPPSSLESRDAPRASARNLQHKKQNAALHNLYFYLWFVNIWTDRATKTVSHWGIFTVESTSLLDLQWAFELQTLSSIRVGKSQVLLIISRMDHF